MSCAVLRRLRVDPIVCRSAVQCWRCGRNDSVALRMGLLLVVGCIFFSLCCLKNCRSDESESPWTAVWGKAVSSEQAAKRLSVGDGAMKKGERNGKKLKENTSTVWMIRITLLVILVLIFFFFAVSLGSLLECTVLLSLLSSSCCLSFFAPPRGPLRVLNV